MRVIVTKADGSSIRRNEGSLKVLAQVKVAVKRANGILNQFTSLTWCSGDAMPLNSVQRRDSKVVTCIDTGSPVSFISNFFFKKYFRNLRIFNSRQKFCTVFGDEFYAFGFLVLKIKLVKNFMLLIRLLS